MFSPHETIPGVLRKESCGGPPEGMRTGACGTWGKAGGSRFVQAQKGD